MWLFRKNGKSLNPMYSPVQQDDDIRVWELVTKLYRRLKDPVALTNQFKVLMIIIEEILGTEPEYFQSRD